MKYSLSSLKILQFPLVLVSLALYFYSETGIVPKNLSNAVNKQHSSQGPWPCTNFRASLQPQHLQLSSNPSQKILTNTDSGTDLSCRVNPINWSHPLPYQKSIIKHRHPSACLQNSSQYWHLPNKPGAPRGRDTRGEILSPFPRLCTGPRVVNALAKVKGEAVFSERGRRQKNPNQIWMCFYTMLRRLKKR